MCTMCLCGKKGKLLLRSIISKYKKSKFVHPVNLVNPVKKK